MGQFREAMDAHLSRLEPGRDFEQMRTFFQQISRDAKIIRSDYLKGLGSKSYGSLLRKHLQSSGELVIFGAGQLVEEILPWVSGAGRSVRVYCRNPEKARARFAKFAGIGVASFSDMVPFRGDRGEQAVVIAAPLSADVFGLMLKPLGEFQSLFDFRADSDVDRIACAGTALRLPDFFRELEATASFQGEQVEKARAAIVMLTQRRIGSIAHRPFGWEDVCA